MHGHASKAWRGGQVLILFSASVVLLFCILALAVDLGQLCVSSARLQNSADAAALAALLELWEHRAAGGDEPAARDAALAEAQRVVQSNYSESGGQITFGNWDGDYFSAVDAAVAANAVRVESRRNESTPGGPVKTFFAGLVNVRAVDQVAFATARFQPKKLLPFCIYEGDVPGPGGPVTVYDDTIVAPGVFGLLDFNGGANDTVDQVAWTTSGYEGPFYIDPATGSLVVEGNTGFVAALNTPIDDHIVAGDTVVACVYRSVWGTGASTEFEVVGFVSIVLTGRGNTKVDGVPMKYVAGEVVSTYIVGNGETSGTMRDIMHLRLVQ